MKIFYFFSALLFMLLSIAAARPVSKKVSKPKREPASFKYTISDKEWMGLMSRDMPKAFCNSREYYGYCFDADSKACGAQVEKITGRCYRKLNIPKTVRIATHGIDLGQALGRCVGIEFEKAMSAKRKNIPVCKESRQWF